MDLGDAIVSAFVLQATVRCQCESLRSARGRVRSGSTSMNVIATRAARLERIADRLEWPIAILALLIVPALVLEEYGTDARLREAAYVTNWVVWLAFCGELGIRWAARPRLRFLRDAWVDLLLIVNGPPQEESSRSTNAGGGRKLPRR